MFMIEQVVVWSTLMPRHLRHACFFVVSPFQAVIILTANYAFLNYIVLFLGVLLLDDRFLRRPAPAESQTWKAAPWPARILLGWIAFATLVLFPGISHRLPRPLLWPAIALEPPRIANRYGLFAAMTNDRCELALHGSRAGARWPADP